MRRSGNQNRAALFNRVAGSVVFSPLRPERPAMARRNPTEEDIALERLPRAPLTRESLRQTFALARYVRPYRARFLSGLATLFVSAALGLAFPLLAGALIAVHLEDPGGGVAAQVEALLHRHRTASERPGLSTRQCIIRHARFGTGALEVADDDGVDLSVKRLDARDGGLAEFSGAERLAAKTRCELGRRHLVQACIEGHGAILVPITACASAAGRFARFRELPDWLTRRRLAQMLYH